MQLGESRTNFITKLARMRSSQTQRIDSVELELVESRYLGISKGESVRLMAILRVGLGESFDDTKLDYNTVVRVTLQQQRMKGLLDGLHRSKIPFFYMILVKPSGPNKEDNAAFGGENRVFEFDFIVGTWLDTRAKEMTAATSKLDQNCSVLAAALAVGVPNSAVTQLTRKELREFTQSLFLGSDARLSQVADSSSISRLESFDHHSPTLQGVPPSPDFYIPNAAESGTPADNARPETDALLMGKIKTRANAMHDFRLRWDDLKRHVTILGMTGAGKSTTASVVIKQVAEMGIPAMVLDWHNEHGDLVRSLRGTVLVPGRDNFAINPLEMTTDPVEHVALTTDIFSDIYHFTHPQAYMFRNVLQQVLGDVKDLEVPRLSNLVARIEAYPLKSAYDNETKVALLRRIVPLTEGLVGNALNAPSSHSIEQLLDRLVCIELGQIRDLQTRSVFVDMLLKMLYEHRVTRREKETRHLLVIEEARNIVPTRRDEDPPSVGERMISELRKFGESMIFVGQFPTQLAAEVVKNSGVRIIHRVAWAEDLNMIGEALNLTREQTAHVANLGVGEAVISLTRLPQPVLVQVDATCLPEAEKSERSLVAES